MSTMSTPPIRLVLDKEGDWLLGGWRYWGRQLGSVLPSGHPLGGVRSPPKPPPRSGARSASILARAEGWVRASGGGEEVGGWGFREGMEGLCRAEYRPAGACWGACGRPPNPLPAGQSARGQDSDEVGGLGASFGECGGGRGLGGVGRSKAPGQREGERRYEVADLIWNWRK